MKLYRALAFLFGSVSLLQAALPVEQKLADFQQLASHYAKRYGPYDWKLQYNRFDLLDLRPWLERVRATKTDLEYYDVCIDYVSSLDDGHVTFSLPSQFIADLGFGTDLYDGRVLVESINRTRLPLATYDFAIGDELVQVDGVSAADLVTRFRKYAVAANPRSTDRFAAAIITRRSQRIFPFAHEIGENATVVIRKASGDLATYTIPWLKSGTPLIDIGPVFTPRTSAISKVGGEDKSSEVVPEVLSPGAVRNQLFADMLEVSAPRDAVLGYGAQAPVFQLPANFQQRLGRVAAEFFYSGTFTSDGVRIGFIRIPSYAPPSTSTALNTFYREILFMQANTDVLVIDDMRNPGGNACFVDQLVGLLTRNTYRSMGFQFRPTRAQVLGWESEVTFLRAIGAETWQIVNAEFIAAEVKAAYERPRGMTFPLPLCQYDLESTLPLEDNTGRIGYTKPVMVLVDEMSASGGDMFPAVLQDNRRALIFGYRTMGLGGAVIDVAAGQFAESNTRVTVSLMNRKNPIVAPGYPVAPVVENIGVQPDIVYDYMTRDNLINRGADFVRAFTAAAVAHSRRSTGEIVTLP